MGNLIYLPELWVHTYLQQLALYGRKVPAAITAGTSIDVVDKYRKESKEFAIQEEQALEAFKFSIHKTIVDQARNGTVTVKHRYKVIQGEKVLVNAEEILTRDNKLLMDLAKTHDDVYKDKGEQKNIAIFINANDPLGSVDKSETIHMATSKVVEDAEEV